ncbi:glutathione S-transferase family protein [Burkholderiaceae bacterium DAT-1]|nr:glutathione S-transferase family protein [Burkholderiaceae bacterium DAT-1]
MLQLCYSPSTASMIPHLLLEEMGVPFELKTFDTGDKAHKSAEYLKLNPNGLIPALIDGDLVIYETAAILMHLLDAHPDSGLIPPIRTHARAHFYKWLMWLTNTLQASLILHFYPERWAEDASSIDQVKDHATRKVHTLLDQIDAEIARNGDQWFSGSEYSALDVYVFTLCRWTRRFERPARSWPHIGPYLQRVHARAATQTVFAREEIVEPWY